MKKMSVQSIIASICLRKQKTIQWEALECSKLADTQ